MSNSQKRNKDLAAAVAGSKAGTPREIVEAFAQLPKPITIGQRQLQLRPMTVGHYNLLESIRSPLVCEDAPDATAEDIVTACLLLSMSPREGRELVGAGDSLADQVTDLVDEMLPAQLAEIEPAIEASLKAAFGTALAMESTLKAAQKKRRRNGLVPEARRRPGG